MTSTLKRQLAVLGGASILAVGMGIGAQELKAQNETPKSSTEAAQLFGRLLVANDPDFESARENPDRWLGYRILSQSDRDKLGISSAFGLLSDLQVASKRPRYDTVSEQKEGETTIVEITPATKPVALPVVIVQENGGYKVDLLATYKKRMNLAEGDFQNAVLEKTGVALEGLPGIDTPYIQNRICQTNLKQLGFGLLQYMQDYDETLPPAKEWSDVVSPYLATRRIFNCPTTPTKKDGYAYNANLSMRSTNYVEIPKPKIEGIRNIGFTILAYETKTLQPNASGTGQDLIFRHKTYDGASVRTNVLFVDGHVQAYPDKKKLNFSLNPPVPGKVTKQ